MSSRIRLLFSMSLVFFGISCTSVCSPAHAYLDEPVIDNSAQLYSSLTKEAALVKSEGVRKPSSYWKCGFIDKGGKVVIEAKYEGCKRFSQGLAPVRTNGKWGFIDPSGAMKIPATFHDAEPFSDGLAVVQKAKKWGYIDATGKMVIPPKFFSARGFSESAAFVEVAENKWSCIDKVGKTQFSIDGMINGVDDFKEGLAVIHRADAAEYTNKKGEKVFPDCGRRSLPFSESLAVVADSQDPFIPTFGYMDKAGKTVVQPKYARAGSFREDFACVCVHEGERQMLPEFPYGKWGYISKDGSTAIAPAFEDAGNFHDGMALILVGKKSLCGYINKKGETVVPAKYNAGFDFSEGLTLVREGKQWRYLDKTGKAVLTSDATMCGNFHEGRALVATLQKSEISQNFDKMRSESDFARPIHHQPDQRD